MGPPAEPPAAAFASLSQDEGPPRRTHRGTRIPLDQEVRKDGSGVIVQDVRGESQGGAGFRVQGSARAEGGQRACSSEDATRVDMPWAGMAGRQAKTWPRLCTSAVEEERNDAHRCVGDWLVGRLRRAVVSPYLALLVGLVVLTIVGLVPYLGTLAKLLTVLFGLGVYARAAKGLLAELRGQPA